MPIVSRQSSIHHNSGNGKLFLIIHLLWRLAIPFHQPAPIPQPPWPLHDAMDGWPPLETSLLYLPFVRSPLQSWYNVLLLLLPLPVLMSARWEESSMGFLFRDPRTNSSCDGAHCRNSWSASDLGGDVHAVDELLYALLGRCNRIILLLLLLNIKYLPWSHEIVKYKWFRVCMAFK